MGVIAAQASRIPIGRFTPVAVNGKRLLVCHTKEGFYAIDDVCTHEESPLRGGWLNGPAIECPLHGARFDVRTGAVVRAPATEPIRSYPVVVEAGHIVVELPEESVR